MMQLNDYLRGKTLIDGGRCYGSIIHYTLHDGGTVETAGGDWALRIDGVPVENSDGMRDNGIVKTLVGRTIRDFRIVSPDACTLTFWDGAVLECRNGAYEGYGMGRELLNVFRPNPPDRMLVCQIHAPLVDLHWERADQPVSASY